MPFTSETTTIQEAMNNNVTLPNFSSSNTANSRFTVKNDSYLVACILIRILSLLCSE